ncbi:MAG: agmatine deiminase family protein [Candidatus Omnitrophica bacterium]|nr:agmatine deiminase family protein [Candidatus Omnitrophota bacterium]
MKPKQRKNFYKKYWIIGLVLFSIIFCLSKVSFRSKQISVGGIFNFDFSRLSAFRMVPEYEKTLKEIFISLSVHDRSLEHHESFLDQLPEYTKIFLFLPKSRFPGISRSIKEKPYANRVHYLTYDSKKQIEKDVYLLFRDKENLIKFPVTDNFCFAEPGTLWSQDYFEVMENDGEILLLIPCIHKYFSAEKDSKVLYPDNECLFACEYSGLEVMRVPLLFKGGNIFVDKINGKQVGFIGGDVVKGTLTVSNHLAGSKSAVGKDGIYKILKNILNVDEVVVFRPDKLQPSLMYHLDQAIVFLPDKHVGVAKIIDYPANDPGVNDNIKDAQMFLEEITGILKSRGYTIVDIFLTMDNLRNFKHFINVIPFVDLKTKTRKVFMPIFPDSKKEDKRIIDMNKKVFESLGYEVMEVNTEVNKKKGGIHCMVNVLK